MKIAINRNSDTPIYIQIKNAIRQQILSGELPTGFKLPAERQISEELGVSRNTMVCAYQELIAEGLVVVSSKPKGYFVREVGKKVPERVFHPLSKMIQYNYTEKENLFDDLFSQSNSMDLISFAGININVPFEEEIEYSSKDFCKCDERESERLKQNICKLLRKQDIFATEKNVQLVSETTQVLEYIASLYLKEGDSVIVEEPVISDTVNVFRNKGIKVVCVKMNEDGMDLDDLQRLIAAYRPKFIYTMPNFHNPTGTVMSLANRVRLLEISNFSGVPIIEENSLRDFRYEGKELPSLYSLDKNEMVIYIDTFTLTFLPGNNTAFVVGPAEPIKMMGRLIVTSQMTIYKVSHAMLNRFIESGGFERRVKYLQEYCRQKRDHLCKELERLKRKGLSFKVPEGGLCVWCKLPNDVNEKKLFSIAREKGLLYMPGNVFFPYGYSGSGYIRLCFSNVSEEEIVKGVKILSESIELSRSDFERWVAGAKLQFHSRK